MPYQRAFIPYRPQTVFYAVSLNSNPRGKEAEVIMSYFCIPQRWTTRGLEQHPRRFRPLRKIKRQQPPTLPKRCSTPLSAALSLSPPPPACLCAEVCRTVWEKSPMSTVPNFLLYRLLFQTQLPELGHFSYVYATLVFYLV